MAEASEIQAHSTSALPIQRVSRFRRARWLPRDAAIGVVLSLLTAAVIYCFSRRMITDVSYFVLVPFEVTLEFGVMLALPLWLLRRRSDPLLPPPRPGRRPLKEVLIAILATIGVLICAIMVANCARFILIAFGRSPETPLDFWGRLPPRMLAPIVILAVAVAPVAEETFFRGFLYNALRRVCPAWLAFIAQALLFALGHVYQPLGVVTTFAIGLLLAAIYEWRKTLLANMLVHGMYNAIGMIVIVTVVMANVKAPMIGVTFVSNEHAPAIVDNVLPESPAAQADIRPADVIVNYDGTNVTDGQQLIRLVRAGKVGDEVVVEILRGEERLEKHLVLRSRADVD